MEKTTVSRVLRFTRIGIVTQALVCSFAYAVNDTGVTLCYDDAFVSACNSALTSDVGTHPRQDARFGRDIAGVSKIGGGAAGFDFSKISNAGVVLPSSAVLGTAPTDWACTRDNVTGLWWEVKTLNNTTPGLRDVNNNYTWYDSNAATNGGNAGSLGISAWCNSTLTQCDSEAYVAAVNLATMCGRSDWRMPSYKEAMSIFNAAISATQSTSPNDPTYFPTGGFGVFTSNTVPTNAARSFYLDQFGGMRTSLKTTPGPLRLVAGTYAYQ
jgi:hypothetical protein